MEGLLRVIIFCCLISLGYEYSGTSNVAQQQRVYTRTTRSSKYFRNTTLQLKTILLWNSFFEMPQSVYFNLGRTGHMPFLKEGCSVKNCFVTDRFVEDLDRPVEEYDAVLIHISNVKWPRLPSKRKSHQRYIFFISESPEAVPVHEDYKGYFNWTMTYRRDSDIWIPYGSLINSLSSMKEDPGSVNFHLIQPKFDTTVSSAFDLSQKKYLVAWFVTNCLTASGREIYVTELMDYIPIHVYGTCGDYSCPKRNKTACFELLERNYKFYLAFENSVCKDYVTEKIFDIIKYNVVPIVYGGANYSEILPPMSYINVADFDTPQDLADYLLYLDKTPEEYVKYFWWKSYYKSHESKVICKLCEMLNNPSLPHKVYPDIKEWWEGEGMCGFLLTSNENSDGDFLVPWIKVVVNRQHKNETYLSNHFIYYCTPCIILLVIFIVLFVQYAFFWKPFLFRIVGIQRLVQNKRSRYSDFH